MRNICWAQIAWLQALAQRSFLDVAWSPSDRLDASHAQHRMVVRRARRTRYGAPRAALQRLSRAHHARPAVRRLWDDTRQGVAARLLTVCIGAPAIFQDLTAGNSGYQATTRYDWASGIGSLDSWAGLLHADDAHHSIVLMKQHVTVEDKRTLRHVAEVDQDLRYSWMHEHVIGVVRIR